MSDTVSIGRIVKAHGIRGGLIVRPATAGSDVLLEVDKVALGTAGLRRVLKAQWQGKAVLLQLDGVTDRNAAEALVGTELLVDKAALPPPDEGEFYEADLVGLEVVDAISGRRYGDVSSLESGPTLSWLVVNCGGREVLVPFTEGLVEVEMASRRVLVKPPEGLFDGDTVG